MKKAVVILNVLVLIGLSLTTGYLFMKNRDLNEQLTLTYEEKNKRLVDEINKVFDLPNENPVVVVVNDVEEFKKTYTTFENAESGDYLLFFRKARLNVLYRQDEKRVVKTANITLPIAVELVGSEEDIKAAEEKLAKFGNQVAVTKTVNDSIKQSFVFDIDADQTDQTKQISAELGYDVGSTLPAGITTIAQTEIVIAVSATTSTPPTSNSETPIVP